MGDEFHSVKTLSLKKCSGMKSLSIKNYNLKDIELQNCATLKSVCINSPNLELFLYRGRDLRPCEIEFGICKKLESVILIGVKINNMMFSDCNKTFPLIKLLTLSCFDERCINISSNSLDILALCKFKACVDINVDAPNLTWFGYNGSTLPSLNMKFPLLDEVRIELHANRYKKRGATWYSRLIKILESLKHAKKLVFYTNSEKNIIIPNEFRDTFVPPFVEMDTIAVRTFYKTRNFVDLFDGMLWICPRVKNLVLRSNYWVSLELVHEELTGDSSCSLCTAHPFRCWRHSVKRFDLNDEKEESKKKTMSYLMENLKMVERDALEFVALE
ncbi:uncharacterized protein [Rutidosis leptorrhynchoides]|uniref:uncharacterized protein n=1 Tax=Rutidosis leptorrhynchoides TaxID=125765 RepID=UPI003A9A37C5